MVHRSTGWREGGRRLPDRSSLAAEQADAEPGDRLPSDLRAGPPDGHEPHHLRRISARHCAPTGSRHVSWDQAQAQNPTARRHRHRGQVSTDVAKESSGGATHASSVPAFAINARGVVRSFQIERPELRQGVVTGARFAAIHPRVPSGQVGSTDVARGASRAPSSRPPPPQFGGVRVSFAHAWRRRPGSAGQTPSACSSCSMQSTCGAAAA
jgi:hypothetical protein